MSYENLVKLEWQTAYGTESFPKEAMLDMRIKAYYRIPKSASKKKRAAMLAGEIRPTKKPDMDNVVKIIADSLNNLAYYEPLGENLPYTILDSTNLPAQGSDWNALSYFNYEAEFWSLWK